MTQDQQQDTDQEVEGGEKEAVETGEANTELAVLAAEVDALKKVVAEEKDKNLRLLAEFENFRRRSLKEQSELLKYQGEKLVLDLLEVLDNLDLALAHSSADAEKLKEGLEMIHRLFVERLAKWDIKGDAGIGQQFDPQKHNAISRVPAGDTAPGTIAAELKKAYFYKDKLIRPGEVVVAAEAE